MTPVDSGVISQCNAYKIIYIFLPLYIYVVIVVNGILPENIYIENFVWFINA